MVTWLKSVLIVIAIFVGIVIVFSALARVEERLDNRKRLESRRKDAKERLDLYGIEPTDENVGQFLDQGEIRTVKSLMGIKAAQALFDNLVSERHDPTFVRESIEEIEHQDPQKGKLVRDTINQIREGLSDRRKNDEEYVLWFLPAALHLTSQGKSLVVKYSPEEGHYEMQECDICKHNDRYPEGSCWGAVHVTQRRYGLWTGRNTVKYKHSNSKRLTRQNQLTSCVSS